MNRNAKLAKKFHEQRMLDRARAELLANRNKRKGLFGRKGKK